MKYASALVLSVILFTCAAMADWPQWRGPNRDGAARQSPPLLSALPAEGLRPLWHTESIPGGNAGGWGCPVVADGKIYLFTHQRALKPGVTLGKQKFPFIAPDKRGNMTDKEYAQYEVNRRNEDEERAKSYEFRETLMCFDAKSGKTLYKSEAPSIYTRFVHSGTVTIDGGKAYVLGGGRMARCFNAGDGKLIWETKLPGNFRDEFYMSSIAAADGALVFVADQLFGLDAATGNILWNNPKARGQHASAAIWKAGGKNLAIINTGGDTLCFDPRSGKEIWRVKSQANHSTPIVLGADRLIVYGSSRKAGLRCYQISSAGAKELWVYNGCGDQGSSPVVVGDHVYVQGERRLACVALRDGQEKWQTQLNLKDPRYSSLLAADGKIFYAQEGMLVFAADPAGFKPLYEAKFDKAGLMAGESYFRKALKLDDLEKQTGGDKKAEQLYNQSVEKFGPLKCHTPAFHDGKLYIRTNDGLFCYDLSSSTRI